MTLELPLFKERRTSQKQTDPAVGGKPILVNARDNLEPILNSAAETLGQGYAGGLGDESQEDDGSYGGDGSYTASKFMKVCWLVLACFCFHVSRQYFYLGI